MSMWSGVDGRNSSYTQDFQEMQFSESGLIGVEEIIGMALRVGVVTLG